MDGSRIQSLVYRGYGIAAAKVGLAYEHYRPQGVNDPISEGNKLGTINASFTPYGKDFQYGAAQQHGKNYFNGLLDARNVEAGDIFVRNGDTYILLSLDPIQPPLLARTNYVLRFVRPQGADQIGLNSYGGSDAGQEDEYMRGWPAALSMGKAGGAVGGLPGDAASAGFEAILPPSATATITPADIAIDAADNRFMIDACERSPIGPRLKLRQVVT